MEAYQTADNTNDALTAAQREAVTEGLFSAVHRLRWSATRLAAERERRLRDLLRVATRGSSFHRSRLTGVDIDHFTEADLPSLPTMDKHDLMDSFDDVVTEPGLTLDRVEAALAAQGGTEPFVLGRHRAVVSSGSSGRRGVFLYGWDDWITVVLLRTRWDVYVGSPLLEPGAVTASFFADKTMHVSGALHAFTSNDDVRVLHLPVSLPLPEVVGRLNEAQPTALIGYPTSVSLAVEEAEAGRLAIRPSLVGTCGELLTDGLRDRVRAVWGLEVRDEWGVSEGVFALPCVPGRPLHLPDDLCIIEPVDAGGRVVAPGTPAARILLTNLYNRTQPLIRYEINDPMTLLDEPCACGCAHRRITGIGGRVEEPFVYAGGTVVHPVALGDPLLLDPAVLDFQVRQTASGVEVSVRTPGAGVDLEPFRRQLVAVLLAAGIPEPTVLISRVDAFDRLWSGKQPRFVRLV